MSILNVFLLFVVAPEYVSRSSTKICFNSYKNNNSVYKLSKLFPLINTVALISCRPIAW